MAVSVTLVLTSLVYGGFAAYFTHNLARLFKSKAPYALFLALGIVIQVVAYVLFLVNFAFLAFLRRQRRPRLLAILSASLFRLLPLILILCTVRALHARLSALKAAQPQRQQGRFRLVKWVNWILVLLLVGVWIFLTITSRTLSDALNGRHVQSRPPILDQVGELVHAVIFTSLTYLILVFSRRMNGFLLLPDQVLLALNTRITPLFLLRSSYTVMDAILPLVHPQIHILTPSLTISADGFLFLVVLYNLATLVHPEENWIDQESTHLVRGMPDVRPEVEPDAEPVQKSSRWSRLISPLRPHRTYGATDEEGSRPVAQETESNEVPEVAIVHGVAASGTQLYAQTGPMAPAWLMQDTVNGKAGAEPIQNGG